MKIDLSRFSGRFRQETRDNLAQLDHAISGIEATLLDDCPERDLILREMMRLIHAVKGGARMLGFSAINQLCHTTEEHLIRLKDRPRIDRSEIDLIVESRRGIERLLSLTHEDADQAKRNPPWLDRLIDQLTTGTKSDGSNELLRTNDDQTRKTADFERTSADSPLQTDNWRTSTVRVDVNSIDDLLYYGRELTQALDGLRKSQKQIDALREQLEANLAQRTNSLNAGVGLTIPEGYHLQRALTRISFDLRDKIAEVDRNVRQIDTGAVELRMRPIAELFETIPLQVRDLSRTLGKEIDVECSGESVRLDGRIVELLREPLLHLIRNAVDHGIESPEERILVGKSPRARVTLGAHENAGWARVVVADDGKGINPEKMWLRAMELGIVRADEPVPSDVKSVYNIMFDDRFTNRVSATDVSGRGVGMGAVKRRLQELRGNVFVESIPELGTRITLLMPTSLSSQHVLITSLVSDNIQRFFAFPTALIKGTSRWDIRLEDTLENSDLSSNGETVKAFSLKALLLGRQSKPAPGENYLVHCSDGNLFAAFAVEQIVAETEIIIEPLPHIACSSEMIAGAAPLTSDEIALVVNVPVILSNTSSSARREVVSA